MVGESSFNFLNVAGSVDEAGDWEQSSKSRLWRYNLHYFDDLCARDPARRERWHRALIARWIRDNPPGAGTGWEPYPTSLRIVNWIKWGLTPPRENDSLLDSRTLDSLAAQTRWLSKKLEFHILANHIWANGKSLAFAGVFFAGPEADGWLRKGLAILTRQLDEQILPDGGHFERSPMYHGIVLEDVLDLINLAGAFPNVLPSAFLGRLQDAATRMLHWLRTMTHPDGKISFFNDASFGVTADYARFVEHARALGVRVREHALGSLEVLEDSGYVRLQSARAVVICDVAPLGPDYLPGHAHADTLSFELSLDGARLLVNSGTSTYESGPERVRQRGTTAHNSVVVDGEDSSEVWSSFRVARRARPLDRRWGEGDGSTWLQASHDGYRRLPGRVTHRRSWILRENGLSVTDNLDGRFASAFAVFTLHPEIKVERRAEATVMLSPSNGRARSQLRCPSGQIYEEPSTWHPEFGRTLACARLKATFVGASLTTDITW